MRYPPKQLLQLSYVSLIVWMLFAVPLGYMSTIDQPFLMIWKGLGLSTLLKVMPLLAFAWVIKRSVHSPYLILYGLLCLLYTTNSVLGALKGHYLMCVYVVEGVLLVLNILCASRVIKSLPKLGQ